jgi:hypothetical protein
MHTRDILGRKLRFEVKRNFEDLLISWPAGS